MNLAYFPFDSQMCTVEIESFGYTMADLKYRYGQFNCAAVPYFITHALYFALIKLNLFLPPCNSPCS